MSRFNLAAYEHEAPKRKYMTEEEQAQSFLAVHGIWMEPAVALEVINRLMKQSKRKKRA